MKKPRSFIESQIDGLEHLEALDENNKQLLRNETFIRLLASHIGIDVDQLEKTGKPWSEVCKTVWQRFILATNPEKVTAIIQQFISELPNE